MAPSTVSRVFSRPGRISAVTEARIRTVAVELGYTPRSTGQKSRDKERRLLAIMVNDLSNPFYNQVVRGAQIASAHAGYELILADFHESSAREKSEHERLADVVDGIVIGSSRLNDQALRAIAARTPTVVTSRELRGVASLIPDNVGGVKAAMRLLHSFGHTTVTYVAGPEASWTDGARYRAICEYNAAAGYSVQRIGPFLSTFEDGMAAARQLVDRPPTAIIAHNDMMAIGVMHGLMSTGIRVPADVSIIGFDDVLSARLVTPKLTTIALPGLHLGLTAVRNVVSIIRGATPTATTPLVLPVQLKIRESTGAVRRSLTLR